MFKMVIVQFRFSISVFSVLEVQFDNGDTGYDDGVNSSIHGLILSQFKLCVPS